MKKTKAPSRSLAVKKNSLKKTGKAVKSTLKNQKKTTTTKRTSASKTPVKREKTSGNSDWHKQINGPWEERVNQKTRYIFLGTAHISPESVADVKIIFEKFKPDAVCVELCDSRYKAIEDPDRWKKMDIVQVIKQKKAYLLLSSMILSSFQKKMGDQTGVKPGEEMMTAISLAKSKNLPVILADRDIQITLRRAWQHTGMFSKYLVVSELITSLLIGTKIDEPEIEKMKNRDALEDLLNNLPGRFHKIREILISERDRFMANKWLQAAEITRSPKRILAIAGAGHLPGISEYFGQREDITLLETLRKKSTVLGIIKFLLPIIAIMLIFAWLTDGGDRQKILHGIYIWVAVKAAVVGIVTAALLAHPLAVIAATISAPFSNFQPIFKPGWLAALIEAKFRKPIVEDFEKVAEDSKSVGTFFKNRVIRVFLMLILPQLASSVATGLALWLISRWV